MKPFERTQYPLDAYDPQALLQKFGHLPGMTLELAQHLAERNRRGELYNNGEYEVFLSRTPSEFEEWPALLHLSIKRCDKAPIHDWRDLQTIKNLLTDPEFEGVELYPAESRCVDSANQYHLFVVASKTFRFPFGFKDRFVADAELAAGTGGQQRPLATSEGDES